MSGDFSVRFSAPVMTRGGAQRELSPAEIPSVVGLSWQMDIAGGLGGAEVTLDPPARRSSGQPLSEAFAIPLGAHIEVYAGPELVYDGFVVERTRRGADGAITRLRVSGYEGSMRSPWRRTDLADAATCGEVLRQALAELAPWLVPGVVGDQWIDPQIVYDNGLRDVARMKLSAIADQVRQGGDSIGRAVWVMVMPCRRVWLLPRVEPPEPDYVSAFDSRVSDWTDGLDEFVTSLNVEYGKANTGNVTAVAYAAGLSEDAGIDWSDIVTAGNLSSAMALALRNSELARRAQPTARGTISVTRDPTTWLTTPAGVPAPWWRPRVGEWVRVGAEPMQPIVGVSVDATGGSATYQLGQPNPRTMQAFWIATRDAIGRQRQMLAPAGGRLR